MRNRIPVDVLYRAPHIPRHAWQTITDVGAVVVLRRILNVEWAEYGGLGAAVRFLVILSRHKGGQAQRVRKKDELLARRGTDLTHCGEEFDAFFPLGLGEPRLTSEGMEMLDQAGHDLAQAGVMSVGVSCQNSLGNRVFVQISHWLPLVPSFL
ncbi:hypothetical protein D3C76_1053720 [compost metagenome]